MTILSSLQGPADLRGLDEAELEQLADEIRQTIISTVATTGGHLGSSLGVVEVTIALHRLLDSPRDRIVWDTGHQAYPHKLLTGRLARFGTLRQLNGVGGFPRRSESPHDVFDGGHAGTGLSIAQGLAEARDLRHGFERDRGRGRRRRDDERAEPRGAQRHRAPWDAAADRAQRQRDVDQPDRRGLQQVPQPDQAVARLAARADRLRPDDRAPAVRRRDGPRAVPPPAQVGRQLRPARPAVRGPRDHLHRGGPRPRPASPSSGRSPRRSSCANR